MSKQEEELECLRDRITQIELVLGMGLTYNGFSRLCNIDKEVNQLKVQLIDMHETHREHHEHCEGCIQFCNPPGKSMSCTLEVTPGTKCHAPVCLDPTKDNAQGQCKHREEAKDGGTSA